MTRHQKEHGISLIEIVVVLAIVLIGVAIAVPSTRTALSNYRLSSAVAAVTGMIQATRYQAIMKGYHYNITFSSATTTYQIASKVPPAAGFTNVGGLVPWVTTGAGITMTPTTTLEFFPGGTVQVTTGNANGTFTITNGKLTKTVTISGVGNVSVTP